MLFRYTNKLNSINQLVRFSFTTKSRRQTTPNLFQNPKLTKHGLIQRIPSSYDYNLPETLPNRHLYWDRKVQNKARRVQYNAQRLQKLGIKPIHQNGKRTFERTSDQILYQLSNGRLIKGSINRTFVNLSEILIRFKNELSVQDLLIVEQTIDDVHQRYLPSLSLYHFSTFCQIRAIANKQCTEQIFIHFYKFIQQFSEMSQMQNQQQIKIKKFKFKVFLKILRYVFANKNAQYIKKNQQMMYKNQQMFKLFEDNNPRFISFQELVPYIYTKEQIAQQINDQDVKRHLKYLKNIPGGSKLILNLQL